MPEFLWAQGEGLGRRLALAPLQLLEAPYRLGAWLHRGSYRWFPRRRVRLPLQVVSVGNLTVGGSAKTPVVGWLARELASRGRQLAVLSRGVRARRRDTVNVVSDGERLLLSAADAGDEPVLLARELPGIPVLSGRNRAALGYRAAALFGADLVLLDDGFQHHRVERDVDLVCIDADLGFGNGHVLPRGPLRESPRVLRRADALVWTRVDEGFAPPQEGRFRDLPSFSLRVVPRALRPLLAGSAPARPLDLLRGRKVGALAAIARPDRFVASLEALGAEVIARKLFADHHLYAPAELRELDPELLWVTTAKDAVKLPGEWLAHAEVCVLQEEVEAPTPSLADFVLERLSQ